MKTVSEVAKLLNVTKQTIYNQINEEDFKENYTEIKSVRGRDIMMITPEGLEILKEKNLKTEENIDSNLIEILNKTILLLENQLNVKDNQIMELNQRLRELSEQNKNNQILIHREQDKLLLESNNNKFSIKRLFSK